MSAFFIGIRPGNLTFGTLIVVGISFLVGVMFVKNYYFLGKNNLPKPIKQKPGTLLRAPGYLDHSPFQNGHKIEKRTTATTNTG